MDDRRLNTAQVLAAGILDIEPPKSEQPADAVLARIDEDDLSEDTLLAGLNSGGIAASMYYGCWSIWRTERGFSGELRQYRAITGSFVNQPLEAALAHAVEWGSACYG